VSCAEESEEFGCRFALFYIKIIGAKIIGAKKSSARKNIL
jgi:hypothetical protein